MCANSNEQQWIGGENGQQKKMIPILECLSEKWHITIYVFINANTRSLKVNRFEWWTERSSFHTAMLPLAILEADWPGRVWVVWCCFFVSVIVTDKPLNIPLFSCAHIFPYCITWCCLREMPVFNAVGCYFVVITFHVCSCFGPFLSLSLSFVFRPPFSLSISSKAFFDIRFRVSSHITGYSITHSHMFIPFLFDLNAIFFSLCSFFNSVFCTTFFKAWHCKSWRQNCLKHHFNTISFFIQRIFDIWWTFFLSLSHLYFILVFLLLFIFAINVFISQSAIVYSFGFVFS